MDCYRNLAENTEELYCDDCPYFQSENCPDYRDSSEFRDELSKEE